jgi:serine/threonine-protein kinase
MVDYELAQDQPRSAQLLLRDLDQPPTDLAERVEAAIRAKESRDRKLARLAAQHDTTIGWRTRNFLIAIVGLLWVILPLTEGLLKTTSALINYQRLTLTIAVLGVTVIGLAIWARESLMKSVLNRRLTFIAIATQPSMLILLLGCHSMGLGIEVATQLSMFLWFVFATITTITTSPKLAPMTFGYLGGFFAAIQWPEQTLTILSVCNAIMLVNVGVFSLARRDPQ